MTVRLSVAEAVVVRPTPPIIVAVLPEVIGWLTPPSPARVKSVVAVVRHVGHEKSTVLTPVVATIGPVTVRVIAGPA